ncbi:MAG: hypothetical protein NC432_07665 [Roseburia sp.]|nr:hypothetical protein [Roseburia sp.]MCM1099046.1 hypothetical protein [Ruminococcus flavefaciens]
MRITNKIMQNNNLSNINTNKIYQDRLSTQMSTQKKINRPSDDPVVAIRALRLRSSVTEVTQYYSKNIPDANSWLEVTEDALLNLSDVLTGMIRQCEKGVNTYLKTEERQILLEQLKALGDEVYSTGDADYAGRFVFTGYRTDTSLSFEKEESTNFSITEQLTAENIDSMTRVNLKDADGNSLLDLNSSNFSDAGLKDLNEEDVTVVRAYRIRLSYNSCSDYEGTLGVSPKISYIDENGDEQTWSGLIDDANPAAGGDIRLIHSYDDPYAAVTGDGNEDAIVYVPETGEILLGENRYRTLMGTKDNASTVKNEAEIRVTYEKNSWQKGDLRPQHYFYCEEQPRTDEALVYNKTYLSDNVERQDIEYDVGFNQTIRVNSTADQCFRHGIGREVDDLTIAIQDVLDLEGVKANLDKLLESAVEGSENQATLKKQLAAVNKALTYAKDKEKELFSKGISSFQGYLDDASLCITECGTRSSKLSLIENRTQNQKTTFETLKSQNEDVDITEVMIYLTSADLTYQAALMATGKVSQTTLLNYI